MSAAIKAAVLTSIAHADGRGYTDPNYRAMAFACHLAGYIRMDCPEIADALSILMELDLPDAAASDLAISGSVRDGHDESPEIVRTA